MAEAASASPPALDAEQVRGLVFDLDGTLVDSYRAIAESLNHARSRFELPPLPDDEVRRNVGHGLEVLVADLVGPGRVEEGARLFRERYAEAYRDGTVALPGVRETLRLLAARGYAISVASNKPARFGEPILEHLGMLPFVTAVEGPDRAGSTKPEPTMLRRCLQAMGIDAAAGAYVGDMVLDVQTAALAGVPVVLVCGGSSTEAELRATGETVLGSFDRLLDLFCLAREP
jgi:phosphoglycolate phosphatase